MGKKYDAYAKAAEAETETRTRLEAEKIGGDAAAISQASTDAIQASRNANFLWNEVMQDPEG